MFVLFEEQIFRDYNIQRIYHRAHPTTSGSFQVVVIDQSGDLIPIRTVTSKSDATTYIAQIQTAMTNSENITTVDARPTA